MQNLENSAKKAMAGVLQNMKSVNNEREQKLETLRKSVGKVVTLPILDIQTDDNVRKKIDENSEAFRGLIESIKKYGILENAVAELHIDGEDYRLVCVAGHRRILAAKQLGITKIPCMIREHEGEATRVGAALSENLNREDLHALDISDGYATLTKDSWSIEQLARFYGRDVRTIQHYLKLSTWPQEIKDLVRQHPSIFSTRVLLREFAYKAFASTEELRNKIEEKIDQNKAKGHVSVRKMKLKEKIDSYFQDKKDLSAESKREIVNVLKFLNLL